MLKRNIPIVLLTSVVLRHILPKKDFILSDSYTDKFPESDIYFSSVSKNNMILFDMVTYSIHNNYEPIYSKYKFSWRRLNVINDQEL